MFRDQRLALIGAGMMGEAILSGLLRNQVISKDQLVVVEPRSERRQVLEALYGVQTTDNAVEAATWSTISILAVKPQSMPKLLPTLRGILNESDLVISIVAGATIESIAEGLQHQAVIRSMPNTPAQIGEGMTVWTAAPSVNADQREAARSILGSFGKELFVSDENLVDVATAINGSGPAYFFLIFEAMIDAGVHLGLTRDASIQLVLQTALGSARYAIESGKHPAELRNNVTSPGGTTAAALAEMERGALRAVLSDGMWAAYNRSAELGKKK
jgi:pyrroline-5-carboxylate reductase